MSLECTCFSAIRSSSLVGFCFFIWSSIFLRIFLTSVLAFNRLVDRQYSMQSYVFAMLVGHFDHTFTKFFGWSEVVRHEQMGVLYFGTFTLRTLDSMVGVKPRGESLIAFSDCFKFYWSLE
jgi:hypothetical protein